MRSSAPGEVVHQSAIPTPARADRFPVDDNIEVLVLPVVGAVPSGANDAGVGVHGGMAAGGVGPAETEERSGSEMDVDDDEGEPDRRAGRDSMSPVDEEDGGSSSGSTLNDVRTFSPPSGCLERASGLEAPQLSPNEPYMVIWCR